MIDEQQAKKIAEKLLGRPADDPEQPWHLEEFPQGWIINTTAHLTELYAGGLLQVIEKENDRVMRFPSFVPPPRIRHDYENILRRGFPEDIGDLDD